MSTRVLIWCGLLTAVLLAGQAIAAPVIAPADLDDLYRTLTGVSAKEDVRLMQTEEGYVRFLGAPEGAVFEGVASQQKALKPGDDARAFLQTHARVFGIADSRLSLNTKWVKQETERSYVRLQQRFEGLPVFAAEVAVQIDNAGDVESVLSDVMRMGTSGWTSLNTQPTLMAAQAIEIAKAYINVQRQQELKGAALTVSTPELMILDPAVVGAPGSAALVWRMEVRADAAPLVNEAVFVNARTGAVAFNYSLVHTALDRTIRDANYTRFETPVEVSPGVSIGWVNGVVVRTEGQGPSGLEEADAAYDYLGDTYSFYSSHHGRDGIDGQGAPMDAVVRIGYGSGMGWDNAQWTGLQMLFGPGFVVDDVVGHELTHGVTDYESGLVYAYQSGAINESFSDIWGEFIDLTNGRGNDSDEVRWLIGEDMPVGAIRDMKNPSAFGDPDRMSKYLNYSIYYDSGGVHINSGIGNKLAYLLTDGDTFNGYTVKGMGISRVAGLFYELQAHLLTPGSDYYDLYAQLYQASMNAGWNYSDRLNLQIASRAVEIVPPWEGQKMKFQAVATADVTDRPVVELSWSSGGGTLRRAVVVRKEGSFPTSATDGLEIYRGTGNSFLDGISNPLATSKEYFYALFADVTGILPPFTFARATTPGPGVRHTEAFSDYANPIDLAYSQILFSPVTSTLDALASGQRQDYYNYSSYQTTVTRGVYNLPVPREGAIRLPMTDDGYITLSWGGRGFPFFGEYYSSVVMASNGYIAPYVSDGAGNFPSLAAQYEDPRVSFLFADLAPNIGGEVWGRSMDDRWVLTYDHVPEFTYFGLPRGTNTFQVELFTSGHIRITYLDLSVGEAIVGLSDGRGVPRDPADFYQDLISVPPTTDLSNMLGDPQQLIFWPPVAEQVVKTGDWLTFTVATKNFEVPPMLTAQWDAGTAAPFTDNRDGTGTFRWRPGFSDLGNHSVTITAKGQHNSTSMDVGLYVYEKEVPPTAQSLAIHTDDPEENPRVSREVSDNTSLRASYEYQHPMADEFGYYYEEGASTIIWFRNGAAAPTFLNQTSIPASVTKPGDTWVFTVTPKPVYGLSGTPVTSPRVTVVARPQVDSISPAIGATIGGTEVVLTGTNLSYPLNVYFGGIRALAFRAVSDTEIRATTPVHLPGDVDVKVVTSRGEVVAERAFRYERDLKLTERADLNDDGRVDAVDVQLAVNTVLGMRSDISADVNADGGANAADIQAVVYVSLER